MMTARVSRLFLSVFLVGTVIFTFPSISVADVGVGVGSGRITVEQPLKPGGIYDLPSIPVLNTGDVPGNYEMSIEYHEGQAQHKPERSWFSFSPPTFQLNPKGSQIVKISIKLPVKTEPGEYFAYLEAHPVKVDEAGKSRVTVAAAAKLFFTVEPANIFQGIYFFLLSFLTRYAPWTYIVLAIIAASAVLSILRRYVSFNIGIKKT